VPIENLINVPTRVNGLDGWPDSKIPRTIRYRVTLLETALEICRAGLAVGYFPKIVVQLHNKTVAEHLNLSEFNFPSKIGSQSQEVFLVRRRSTVENTLIKQFIAPLRKVLQSE
jgi:hypothetical protein